jgi:hypothetical protein
MADRVGAAASDAGRATASTARAPTASSYQAAASATYPAASRASRNWLPWLIGLLVLAALAAWYLLGQRREAEVAVPPPRPETTTTAPTAVPSPPAAPGLAVGGVDLGSQVKSALDTVRSSLQGISDSATAQSALPRLQDASVQLDRVGGLAGQLPADARRGLANLIAGAVPRLNEQFDRVLAIPGVAGTLGPTIETLRGRLDQLSRA